MTTVADQATQIQKSANDIDFYNTIHWIMLRKAKGENIQLPNDKLYPFLHIEESTEHDESIIEAWRKMIHHRTRFAANAAAIEWIGGLHIRIQTGFGANHIYFKDYKLSDDRIAIIYFDPYEI